MAVYVGSLTSLRLLQDLTGRQDFGIAGGVALLIVLVGVAAVLGWPGVGTIKGRSRAVYAGLILFSVCWLCVLAVVPSVLDGRLPERSHAQYVYDSFRLLIPLPNASLSSPFLLSPVRFFPPVASFFIFGSLTYAYLSAAFSLKGDHGDFEEPIRPGIRRRIALTILKGTLAFTGATLLLGANACLHSYQHRETEASYRTGYPSTRLP